MSKVIADLSVVTSVGLDLAKHVFQVHAVDAGGNPLPNRGSRFRSLGGRPVWGLRKVAL